MRYLLLILFIFLAGCTSQYQTADETEELSRNYPEIIKGNWEPGIDFMETILSSEVENIKDLGVNTLSVVPHYDYRGDVPILRDGKERHIEIIEKAKQAGFAVLLAPDFVGGDNNKIPVTIDQFLADARNISLEWAQIAEEYKVEYFAPQNEFDWVIRFSFYNEAPEKFEEAINISNQWHVDILPEIKKVFGGKTIFKIASESEKSVATGYDYIGLDFGHYQNNLDEFRARIKKAYVNVESAASQSEAGWLVGEAWMPYRERKGPVVGDVLKNSNGESIDELQDDYFRIAIEEYQNFSGETKPSGFFFIAYLMDGMEIKDRPAEEVIRLFFGESELARTETKETNYEQEFFGTGTPSCGSTSRFFTTPHISVSELSNIVPLGNLNPKGGHVFPTNHLYFHLKSFQGQGSAQKANVVAPGDIWITRIGSSEYTMRGENILDYKIDFEVCDDIKGYFIHLTSLSQSLLEKFGQNNKCDEYDTGGVHYKNCQKDFRPAFLVKAGEPIGTVGGSSDFGLADLRTPELTYANKKRWYDEPLHRVCPLDYFTPELEPQLKSLLGSSDTKRSITPACGEVAQDISGTAQGVWFVKGTTSTYPEDPHISLVHDNVDPRKGVFSVGTSVPSLEVDTYYFAPKSSGFVDRDFKDVKPDGNVYCYEPREKFGDNRFSFVILIQLKNPTSLIVEKRDLSSCGSGSWLFGSSYAEFER